MSGKPSSAALRALPAVGTVVERLRRGSAGASEVDGELLTFLTRQALAGRRRRLRRGPEEPASATLLEEVVAEVAEALERWQAGPAMERVLNATGVVLHSGLGRAVLAPQVTESLAGLVGYVLLEVDREQGRRRPRDAFLEELLCHLTGAEAALVVNNNAAATMLALNTLAAGREVVVSRSQMIEIGGSFRMPDVMAASGCRLREVGTTNRSRGRDYEEAIGDETGALMLVHTSNYRIVGFTEHVGLGELVEIGRRAGLPVLHDLGSGSLVPAESLGCADEPPVPASVRAGAAVVCFSGDKMIGGVQAGILVGEKRWIERLRRNPLARAFRIDKLTCVALETVLKLYLEPSKVTRRIPALQMMTEPAARLADRAGALAAGLRARLTSAATVELIESASQMGSGALPAVDLPTTCVALRAADRTAEALARGLRMGPLPVFTRLHDDRVLLDPRTLLAGEEEELVEALARALGVD